MGYGQQMKHGVGGASHRYVESHGVEDGGARGYAAGEYGFIAVAVIAEGVVNYHPGSTAEQFKSVHVGGHYSAVARQSQPYGFVERVHGVGCEHAGA